MSRARRLGLIALVALTAAVLLLIVSTISHLRIPAPGGQFPVGRTRLSWIDADRPERHTPDPSDRREVVAQLWYPAESGTGQPGAYISDLDAIGDGLVASGEVSQWQAAGLRYVRDEVADEAEIADVEASYPLVVLSPGNATNVGFYAALAEELASHGYVVMGIDHPYQVTAVRLADGRIATYQEGPESSSGGIPSVEMQRAAKTDISERVADIRFALDRLLMSDVLAGRVSSAEVAVIGHSNGGIAAVEACRADDRFDACQNIDGQQAGGPFSTDPGGGAPEQPFMFVTKETMLHPEISQRFEAAGRGAFRVVIPNASHEAFGDTSLFKPSFNPFGRTSDAVVIATRGFTLAFLDHVLKGRPIDVLGSVDTSLDVFVNVYPLGDNPPLPQES